MSYDLEISALVEQLIRVGSERDKAVRERDDLRSESYALRSRVAYLEETYEPRPQTFWKQIEVDAQGKPLRAEDA